MEDQPVTSQISSTDFDRRKAKEAATFLRSWNLGKEPGSARRMNLQRNSLIFATERSFRDEGSTNKVKALVLEVAFK